MNKKIFISYSHKDEEHKDSLIEHMALLKRTGLIHTWSDRDILAGDEWKNKISQNLEEADIILFLISSSFISSDYCFEIEAKRAIEKHKEGSAILIPIIVRPVVWTDMELSNFQGLPKDAKPVTDWKNIDAAWVDVIEGIKKSIDTIKTKPEVSSILETSVTLLPETYEWLDDTSVILSHRYADKIRLSEIYVTPDLKTFRENDTEQSQYKDANNFTKSWNENIIFSGEEQQGRTSLLKYYYKEALADSVVALYISGKEVNSSDITKILTKALSKQYDELSLDEFLVLEKKVIFIDDFDEIKLNIKYRNIFLENICDACSACYITVQTNYTLIADESPCLDDFEEYEILELGHKKREQLYRLWHEIGVRETITEAELIERCEGVKNTINAVLRQNIIPAKPIYIVSILQMQEASNSLNLELSSHGHCYQQLIYKSFENANIRKQNQIEKYLNVLKELAWLIFTEGKPNSSQLEVFFSDYNDKYLKITDAEQVIRNLKSCSILDEKDGRCTFKYPYIYYFFVGQKIADSFSTNEDVKEKVEYLITNLHREDNANILIFVTHHTREQWIIDKITKALTEPFIDHDPAQLSKEQLAFMNDFVKKIPELVLEQRETLTVRDEHNAKLDHHERQKNEVSATTHDDDSEILASINQCFKSMEIAGQILRNRHSSLEIKPLKNLAFNGVQNGLRFLEYFISISDISRNEIVRIISTHLEDDPSCTNEEIEKYAEEAFLQMSFGVISGVIQKIATSLGSREITELYKEIKEKTPTPAMTLLQIVIELQFEPKINFKNIENAMGELETNIVCSRILKELILKHVYLFDTGYKDKQRIQELLKVTTKSQRQISQKRKQYR